MRTAYIKTNEPSSFLILEKEHYVAIIEAALHATGVAELSEALAMYAKKNALLGSLKFTDTNLAKFCELKSTPMNGIIIGEGEYCDSVCILM